MEKEACTSPPRGGGPCCKRQIHASTMSVAVAGWRGRDGGVDHRHDRVCQHLVLVEKYMLLKLNDYIVLRKIYIYIYIYI
jgi:hypothetical protein